MKKNVYRISKTVISSLLVFCALETAAQSASSYTIQLGALMSAHWVYAGALNQYWHKSLHAPADTVRELPMASGQVLPAPLLLQADAVANSPYRVTLTLIDKGQVVYRRNREGVRDDS